MRERITYPGGVYTARRTPCAEVIGEDHDLLVVRYTHDLVIANRLAATLLREERWEEWSPEDLDLAGPRREWMRARPALPHERDYGHDYWLDRDYPGKRGVFPVVVYYL